MPCGRPVDEGALPRSERLHGRPSPRATGARRQAIGPRLSPNGTSVLLYCGCPDGGEGCTGHRDARRCGRGAAGRMKVLPDTPACSGERRCEAVPPALFAVLVTVWPIRVTKNGLKPRLSALEVPAAWGDRAADGCATLRDSSSRWVLSYNTTDARVGQKPDATQGAAGVVQPPANRPRASRQSSGQERGVPGHGPAMEVTFGQDQDRGNQL